MWKSAKTLEELEEKAKGLGLGNFSFDGYTGKESLKIGNETAEHFHDLFNKFPKLKEELGEKQKLRKFWITKDLHIAEDAFGRYYSNDFAIDIGGGQLKEHYLKLGKNFSIGKDYFSTARHEFGHHLQENVLMKDDFKDKVWRKIAEKENVYDFFEKNVSKYASSNVQEAFAESFSAYTSPKYKRGMLPKEIEKYFDDLFK